MNAKAEEMEEKAGAEAVKRDPRWDRLCANFEPDEYQWINVGWDRSRKQYTWAAYVSGAALESRLNTAIGPENWERRTLRERLDILPLPGKYDESKGEREIVDKHVISTVVEVCILGVCKQGTGVCIASSEQAAKAAETDAFKRALHSYGIGSERRSIPLQYTSDAYKPPKTSPVPPSPGPTHVVSGGKADAKAPAASEDMLAELETTKALLRDKVGKNAAMVYKAIVQKVRPADPKNPTDQEIEEIVQALHDGPLKSDADSGADPF